MNTLNKYQINKSSSKEQIICYLLREYYKLGWCTGSGGGITIREDEKSILIAPSGVHKEFVEENELFLLDLDGKPLRSPENNRLSISECTPLFLQAYKLRNAGAVIHSHSVNALLITNIFEREFQCINLEMIKGITGHINADWCRVPIIENTQYECDLTESLKNAIIEYPRSFAVLVRNHGIYVWGPTWEKAKIHVECYEYLFKAILKMRKHNITYQTTVAASSLIRAWIIDDTKKEEDLRNDLQHKEPRWVSEVELNKTGVFVYKLNGEKNK